MNISITHLNRSSGRRLLLGSLALGAAATVAACGSSSPGAAPGSKGSVSSAAFSIGTRNVPGVGAVLVNRQGRTLYLLTSEKGGKITCTEANGCTKFWPETLLAHGMTAATAGTGVQASLLGTVTDANGKLEVTYNRWPLYTFAHDSGPGMAHGEGVMGFGGTWYVLNASGTPVKSRQPQAGSASSSGAGYGY